MKKRRLRKDRLGILLVILIVFLIFITSLFSSNDDLYKNYKKTTRFTVVDNTLDEVIMSDVNNNPNITYQAKTVNNVPILEAYINDGISKPLVFVLHGLDGCKENNIYLLTKFAEQGFYAVSLDASGHGKRTDGSHMFYEIVVQTGYDCMMLIDYYAKDELVDENNYGVTGFSMGGMTSYWLAAYSEYRPRIIAPMCSSADFIAIKDLYLTNTLVENGESQVLQDYDNSKMLKFMEENDPASNIDGFKGTYVYIAHGTADELINFEIDRIFYNELVQSEINCDFKLYEHVGHAIPNDFIPYLLSKFKSVLQ